MALIIALYILTGIWVMCIEYRKVSRSRKITFGTFCFSFFAVFCCIIPGLTIWDGDLSRCIRHSEFYAAISYFITLICCISAYLGYNTGRSHYKSKRKERLDDINSRNITATAVILLIISIISLYLYTSGYGGIIQTMMSGGQIRASFIQSENQFTFFKHFIPLSIISSLLIYTDIFIKKNKKKIFFKILLLIVSIIISLIYIMANDGRLLAGIYLLLFIIINLKYKFEVKRTSLKKMIFGGLFVCVIIFFVIIQSESWFSAIRNVTSVSTDKRTILDTILGEFNFIYVGLHTAIYYQINSNIDFVIVNDFVNGLFAWLPTSLKPIIYEDVWDFNTKLINDGGYGQSPVNIVGQSVYDLGLIGAFLIPFLYTYIVGKLENIFINNYSTVGLVFFCVIGFYLGKAMMYSSFYNIMMNVFFIAIAWMVYHYIIAKLKI